MQTAPSHLRLLEGTVYAEDCRSGGRGIMACPCHLSTYRLWLQLSPTHLPSVSIRSALIPQCRAEGWARCSRRPGTMATSAPPPRSREDMRTAGGGRETMHTCTQVHCLGVVQWVSRAGCSWTPHYWCQRGSRPSLWYCTTKGMLACCRLFCTHPSLCSQSSCCVVHGTTPCTPLDPIGG